MNRNYALANLCEEADRCRLPTPPNKGYMPTWHATLFWSDPADHDNLFGLERDVMTALNNRDYSICLTNEDGRHGPLRAGYDDDMPEGYAVVECAACGQTTGIPIPPTEEINW